MTAYGRMRTPVGEAFGQKRPIAPAPIAMD
jgi:hypothetical protein